MNVIKCFLGVGLISLLCSPRLHAQTQGVPFAEMSVNSAKEALESPLGTDAAYALVDQAFKSQRLDLISVCFQNPPTSRKVFDTTLTMPESILKDKVLIMMLRSTPSFWGGDVDTVRFGPDPDVTDAMSAYQALAKHYLVNFPLTKDDLNAASRRRNLADKIESAMFAAGSTTSSKAADLGTGSTSYNPSKIRGASTPDVAKPSSSNAIDATVIAGLNTNSPIPWIIGGVLAALLLFLVARKALRL